jgi:hypothetical protein
MIWADSLTNLQSIGGVKKQMAVMEVSRTPQMEQKEQWAFYYLNDNAY